MVVVAFPPVSDADDYGLLAVGGDLEVESLLLAYRNGIFPWPSDEQYEQDFIPWYAPPKRALLFLEEFRLSRSLEKALKRNEFTFSVNTNCPRVIAECAQASNRRGSSGTWITEAMVQAYTDLHYAGYCHSVECYRDKELVGGLYGVSIGGMFAGESMFYKETNASKLALCWLVSFLKQQKVHWIDCQQLTPLFETLGAREISRDEFMSLLEKEVDRSVRLFENP